MAKIDIHIDTEDSGSVNQTGSLLPTASTKFGLLSTVIVTTEQREAFAKGCGVPLGQIAIIDSVSYATDPIRTGRDSLKSISRCDVIAVTGGLAAYTAIFNQKNNPPYVCLVGKVPEPPLYDPPRYMCTGGISTDALKSNEAKANEIRVLAGCALNQVSLYYDPRSGVKIDEVDNGWNFGAGPAIPFSGT